MASRGGQGDKGRWVYGRHAVLRRLAVNPESVIEVAVLSRTGGRLAEIRELTSTTSIVVRPTDNATLQKHTGTNKHQGVAALTRPFRYRDLREVAAPRRPVLVLDQIQDPQNFGALIRTALAGRMAGVIIPRHRQAEVTPAVEKAAAGAVSDIAICHVANLCHALEQLRSLGFWIIGLAPRGDQCLFTAEIPGPTALVVGGERGLRPLVARTCDMCVSIPMNPVVDSLNASVAAAIAIYELVRRGALEGESGV